MFSNTAAIVTIAIASSVRDAWWVDPVGAILISLVIIYRWIGIINEQVKKIVGHTAPQEFINEASPASPLTSPLTLPPSRRWRKWLARTIRD